MVKSCCAHDCTNRFVKGSGLSFYQFPENGSLRRLWVVAVNRQNWEPNQHSYICSQHFVSGRRSFDSTHPDYVPSVFSHVSPLLKQKLFKNLERYKTAHQRQVKREFDSKQRMLAASVLMDLQDSEVDHKCTPPLRNSNSVQCQTDLTLQDLKQLETSASNFKQSLALECESLRSDKSALKEQFDKISLDGDGFRNDDKKVYYYTGLPNLSTLMSILTIVQPCLTSVQCKTMNSFQQLIMVLMRLRLNLRGDDLSYRFGVSAATVSRMFKKWLDILYTRLNPLIRCPEHEALRNALPLELHGKRVCIVDGLQVLIEKTSDLKGTRSRTERILGQIKKKYTILDGPVPVSPSGDDADESPGIGDKLVMVCSALFNINTFVLPVAHSVESS